MVHQGCDPFQKISRSLTTCSSYWCLIFLHGGGAVIRFALISGGWSWILDTSVVYRASVNSTPHLAQIFLERGSSAQAASSLCVVSPKRVIVSRACQVSKVQRTPSLSQDYQPVPPARRTRLMILHRVQQQHDVTVQAIQLWETSFEILQKPKKWISYRHREIGCEICQSGWRSSQIISKTQKCQHWQTLLMIQIRNAPQEWQPGGTVF